MGYFCGKIRPADLCVEYGQTLPMNGKGLGLIMQNSTKRMAALLLTLVVLLTGFTWPAEAARSYAGTMNRNNVALRSQASNRFTTLAKIDKGEKVTVYELKGNYYKTYMTQYPEEEEN